jgi:hypothetical protein
MEASAYTNIYKHVPPFACAQIYSPQRAKASALTHMLPQSEWGEGTWARARAVQMHTLGGHSQLYTKSTAQNKLPVYFKFIVLKCEMCVCVFAHRRQPREEAPQGEITTRSRSFARLLIASAQPPVGVKCTYTLAHTTPPHSSAALLFR